MLPDFVKNFQPPFPVGFTELNTALGIPQQSVVFRTYMPGWCSSTGRGVTHPRAVLGRRQILRRRPGKAHPGTNRDIAQGSAGRAQESRRAHGQEVVLMNSCPCSCSWRTLQRAGGTLKSRFKVPAPVLLPKPAWRLPVLLPRRALPPAKPTRPVQALAPAAPRVPPPAPAWARPSAALLL